MRGETVAAIGTFFSLTSIILLIFAHVSQLNTSSVPRSLELVRIDVSGLGALLQGRVGAGAPNPYAADASVPLGDGLGLRRIYAWGMHGFCAYLDSGLHDGRCSPHQISSSFRPADVILSDIPAQYFNTTQALLANTGAFADSYTLGSLSHAASWMIFLGSIFAGIALFSGLIAHRLTFFAAAFFNVLGSLSVMIGTAIWTSVFNQSKSINHQLGNSSAIVVSEKVTLPLLWASFGLLLLSGGVYTLVYIAFSHQISPSRRGGY